MRGVKRELQLGGLGKIVAKGIDREDWDSILEKGHHTCDWLLRRIGWLSVLL